MDKLTLEQITPLFFDKQDKDKEGNINPFHYDMFHMGQDFSKTVMLMFANHTSESAKYLILVNKKTGERYRINFPKDWQ